MRPRIGLNCDYRDDRATLPTLEIYTPYLDALVEAGAAPLVIPPVADLAFIAPVLEVLDGLVLIGGRDYDPASYGAAPHPNDVPLHPLRDGFDRRLARWVDSRPDLPVMGICGGCQLLNIGRGGSLVQDIPEMVAGALPHRDLGRRHYDLPRHPVRVDPTSRLARHLGTTDLEVNTSHHQAVARIGHGLAVTARATDGVIEAFEDPERTFYIGVQWHPERMPGDEVQRALFRALGTAAREYACRPAPR